MYPRADNDGLQLTSIFTDHVYTWPGHRRRVRFDFEAVDLLVALSPSQAATSSHVRVLGRDAL
jgi:hypothetical protein